MLHRNGSAQGSHEPGYEQGTIVLDTDIGQLRACWETCPSRYSDPLVPGSAVNIVRCLGIPYAGIPFRWAAPRRETVPWLGVRDCTKFGPQCPQAKEVLFDIPNLPVFGHLDEGSSPVQTDIQDEFHCLNLNIFAPLDIVSKAKLAEARIPVLVWIHGGAYRTGCGGVEIYDASELVARSVRIGSPLIVVTCNYRLGVLGFLHSRQLALDAAGQEEIPTHFRSTANLGLLDTYMAFEWVKSHIASFGGDAQQITGVGESAGAMTLNYLSLFAHLNIKIPRVILSSSTIFASNLLLASEAQTWFDAICMQSGIPLDTTDPVSALRQLPVETLVSKSNFARDAFQPIWDDVTITNDPRRILSDPSLWDDKLEQIVFGHCENESWLRFACLHTGTPNIETAIRGRIPPVGNLREKARALYDAARGENYVWYKGEKKRKLSIAALSWMAFMGHTRYYAVTQLLSDTFIASKISANKTRVVYKYIFSWTPTHWPSDWPATHTADLLPTFLYARLTPSDLAVSCTFADQLILFATGSQDRMKWRKFEANCRVFNVLNQDGSWELRKEGTGEFGLTKDHISLWSDATNAAIKAGRGSWIGMTR